MRASQPPCSPSRDGPPAQAAPRTLEVDSRLVECTGVGPSSACGADAGTADQPWRIFHGQIEGFTFEPGYRYRLKVTRRPVANPPADARAIRTVLVEMVRKLAVEPPADPFAGKVWRLYELQPGRRRDAAPDVDDHAGDRHAGWRAAGKGGCNSWFATAKVDGLELELTGMGATMMACPPPAMDEERAFLAAIGRTAGLHGRRARADARPGRRRRHALSRADRLRRRAHWEGKSMQGGCPDACWFRWPSGCCRRSPWRSRSIWSWCWRPMPRARSTTARSACSARATRRR